MRYVAAGVLAMVLLLAIRSCEGADIPTSVDEAMRQVEKNAKESQENSRYWIEKHQKDDEIRALHDIEDAIIFDSLEEGDD